MNIHFFYEETDFRISHQPERSEWIASVIRTHTHSLNEISYIFCSDDHLLEINKLHLNHDYYTDIITFDHSEEDGLIEADIFISVDRVKENATVNTVSFEQEISRVMIHGVLHLLGFGDKTEEEKKLMREKEDACLSLLKI